ncbi:autotransporter domain-containing protein [Alcanivorax sp. S6407]|uniref:autotransporter family protein n=1 Tax=Alcanivorax sp. S6407 TaxID=2926424 RepID=UPI00248ABE74|nr:autotransporter domain-containing protein [Alcanivorax sp. S6407]
MSLFNRRHHGGESHAARAEILCAFGAALAFLLLLPGAASAAADGTDGSGHDGVTGGQGQDGGDGGLFDDGGNGGDGVSLVYTGSVPVAVSTNINIDSNDTDLTTLVSIDNGDQFSITVDGTTHIVTIYTGETLENLAAKIDQVIAPYGMSASAASGLLEIQGAQNFLDLQIQNILGSPFSDGGVAFDNLPGTLGNASRPFSHGGDGGNGGAGMLLGDVSHIHAAATAGGDGGAGGSSDYYYGNGGHGGDGGAGVELTDGAASVTLAGGVAGPITYTGGNGGQGGDGGAEGIGGDGGNGGYGVLALNGGTLTVDSGAVVAGGDGGLGGSGGTEGSDGIGGYGIHGANLDVTLAGTVNPGANQPTAILFASGDNRLTLESGYSLGGNVLANGSNDVLALGGDVDGSFDTNAVGSTFQGFEGFEKTGASTWTLTGSGAQDWWVREGTLQGNTYNLKGNILNDAHVLIDGYSSEGTYEGTISGSGSVTWDLETSTQLSNKQTYTGLTHVLDGNLFGAADTFAGDILIEAGALIVANGGAAPLQYDGVISGNGGYLINYANVVWTGDHTGFTGQTRLNHGATLTLGTGGNTGTIVGDVRFAGTSPGTLEINRGNDYLYDGVISGAGNLIKNGAGNYILSADHSMTGTATVNAGGMFVNGAMNGVAFTVNDGGLLGGSGSLGSTTVLSGGTLAPGNSIGTLNINGDLTFNSGSVLALEVDPASNSGDVINVTGQANLAGSVLHVGNDGDYQPFSAYTFLNAGGGINGQFDGVTSNYAFLDPSLTYTTDSVSLELLRNDQSFASVVLTDNQRAVANNVDGMVSAHALYQQVVQMSETEAAEAFRVFSGDSLLAGLTAGQQLQQRFAIGMRQRGRNVGSHSGGGMDARLSRQLQALAAPSDVYAQAANSTSLAAQAAGDAQQRQRNSVWVQAQSSRFEEDRQDDVGNAAFTFRGDQLALGMDRQGEQWLLGMAAGSADGTLDYDDRQADGEVSSWFAGLYGRWSSMGAWFLRGDLSYGSSDVSQQRIVLGAPAESDSSVDALRVALESGWDLAWGENGLHPYVQLAMTRIERDSFSETGGGIAGLSVDDSELNSGEAWLGADLSRAFVIGNDWLIAQGGLAVVQPFGDTQTEQTARFAGAAQGFTVYGADEDATQLAANVGAEWFMTDDFSLWLGYRGRFGGDTESHGGLLSANLTW